MAFEPHASHEKSHLHIDKLDLRLSAHKIRKEWTDLRKKALAAYLVTDKSLKISFSVWDGIIYWKLC